MTHVTLYTRRGCQVDIDTDLRRLSPIDARQRYFRRGDLYWQPA